jgi:hypothetical protein
MATVETLRVEYASRIAAQAKADQDALLGMAKAMETVGDKGKVTDEVLKRSTQTYGRLVKDIDGVAAATTKLERAETAHATRVNVVMEAYRRGEITLAKRVLPFLGGAPAVWTTAQVFFQLLLLATPMIVAFWFAPFLVGWDRVSPFKSLFFSWIASWRNLGAMGMFGIAALVLAGVLPGFILIAVSQVAGLALDVAFIALRMMLIFLVAPVLTASIYVSYRDIFHSGVDESA